MIDKKDVFVSASGLDLEESTVFVNRVTKVVTGGRRFRFHAIVAVGDRKGVVGHGFGKANELSAAIQKATDNAKRNLIRVSITKDGTIYHKVIGRAGSGRVLFRPASDGTGIIAGKGVKILLDLVGIKNILTKSLGSTNAHNMVKAAFDGLSQLVDPIDVARRRGISLERVFKG